MTRIGTTLPLAFASIIFALPIVSAQADTTNVGISATKDRVWVYQSRSDAHGQALLRFAFRQMDDHSPEAFRSLPIGPFLGKPMHTAAIGDGLHVFFNDGSHRFFRVTTSKQGLVLSASQSVERLLPNSSLPAAIASDAEQHTLYAVVSNRQARQVEEEAASIDSVIEGTNDTDAGATLKPRAIPSTPRTYRIDGRSIMRYENAEWVFDREAPIDLTVEADVLSFAMHDRVSHVLYRRDSKQPSATLRSSASAEAEWGSPREIELVPDSSACTMGWIDGAIVLVEIAGPSHRRTLWARRFENDQWTSPTQLVDAAGGPLQLRNPLGVCVARDGIDVISTSEAGDAIVHRWASEREKPVESAAPVKGLLPPPPPVINPVIAWILEYAVLGAVLTAVFVWRRERVLVPAPLKPHLAPAQLPRRLLALAIDFVILLPVFGLLAVAFGRDELTRLMQMDVETLKQSTRANEEHWLRLMVGVVMGLYSIPFEILMGATPGKRIVGCEVVKEDGERCNPFQIVLRNVIRAVEYHFVPLTALVLLTPARQRVGDLIAKTVVVQPRLPDLVDDENASDRNE